MSDPAPRWERIEQVYHEVLERPRDERGAFLDGACAGDAGLRAEIESLLRFDTSAPGFLAQSALEEVVGQVVDDKAGSMVDRQIHGYQVRELLGAGGMGEVYRATDLRLGRDVALKILRRSERADPGYLRRFEDEARSASVLNHPNIVTIYGVGEDDDVAYIAMECVFGRTLGEVIAAAPLDIAGALELAVQLSDALAAAHEKGIVHRDLKPDNVMVTHEGRLKVLDFGIAKREGGADAAGTQSGQSPQAGSTTEAGQILGTVGYMSPEQADGKRASAASDQFSFGAILYELLSGKRAFALPTRARTLEAIKRDEPDPLVIAGAARRPLRRVLEQCLAKDPAGRYASTRDLASELRVIRDRVAGRSLTRRQVIWLGSAAAVAVATAGVLGWQGGRRGQRVRVLALLPFENASADPDLEYLSKGLTDTLILRIGMLTSIKVMPATLVSNFKRTGLDARSFAQEIGADSYLTGSVNRSGTGLTIGASLVEVVTGKQLWSSSFTRPDADIQAIQDDIGTEIVNDGIRLQLSEAERSRLVKRETDNTEAYELYLKAGALYEKQTPEIWGPVRELLSRAIALDPKFARAYVVLAGTYATAAIEGHEPPKECWPKSQAYNRDGLSRDLSLPDAYAQNALYEFFYNWKWDRADEAWQMAMRSPGASMYPYLLVGRALQQFALGRTADAVRTMGDVLRLDRWSPLFILKEATYFRADGQLDRAADGYETALRAQADLDAALIGLADVRAAQQRYKEAIDIYRRLYALADPDLDNVLASARGADGWLRIEREIARLKLITYDIRERQGDYVAPIDRARAAAMMGDAKLAFRHLDDALEALDPGVVMLRADRAWTSLRDHPTFQAAVKRVGLPS